MSLSTGLQRIGLGLTILSVFLLPLFFLPLTSDFYDFNKNFLLIGTALVSWIALVVTFVMDKQVRIVRSPVGLSLLLLPIVWLGSTWLKSPNRFEALLEPGQAGTYVALALWFFSITNIIKVKKEVEILAYSLITSLTILGLIAILWGVGLYNVLPTTVSFIKNPLWTPTGSPFFTLILLAANTFFAGAILARHKGSKLVTTGLVCALLVSLAGLGSTAYHLINPPSGFVRPAFLPFSTGWAIALESMKASPLVGTGPATFLFDFTQYRPVAYNLTSHWATRFTTSSNYALQILTTLGLIGLAVHVMMGFQFYKLALRSLKIGSTTPQGPQVLAMASSLTVLGLLFLQLVLPVNFLIIVVTFILLAIAVASLKLVGTNLVHETNIDIVTAGSSANASILPWVFAVLTVLIAIPTVYFGSRAYLADVYFQKALLAASKNDGKTTYDTLIKAITTNPYRDAYRVTYAQTNLLLANSIATKENLSDTDRNNVSKLIQQAIRESKNAIALNPRKVTNAENLANVYQNLLRFAQGADAWTIASYRQAIILDPTNPNLRILLGGVYFSLKNYDEAIRSFQQATDLKPDLANAHYNLAQAYLQKKNLEGAAASLNSTLTILEPSSADYQKVTDELNAVKQQLGEATPPAQNEPAGSALTTPAPVQRAVNPPIELDPSLSPETPATPSSNP